MTVTDVRRGQVFPVSLDPTTGDEIQTTLPGVVVSPDELNAHLRTYIVAPLTIGSHAYPFRVRCRLQGRDGHVVLDQIRTVDRARLDKRLGQLSSPALASSLPVLGEMFAP